MSPELSVAALPGETFGAFVSDGDRRERAFYCAILWISVNGSIVMV